MEVHVVDIDQFFEQVEMIESNIERGDNDERESSVKRNKGREQLLFAYS